MAIEITEYIEQTDVRDMLAAKDIILPAENKGDVFVLWSGGLDSTFLVFWLLSQGFRVTTRHVQIKNNDRQMETERSARSQILNEFYQRCNKQHRWLHISDPLMELKVASPRGGNWRLHLQQMWIFLFSLGYTTGGDVAMGYVRNDDALSWLHDLKNAINVFNKGLFNDPINVHFPLVKASKADMYKDLGSFAEYVVYCEYGEGHCGQCKSCQRMKDIKGED